MIGKGRRQGNLYVMESHSFVPFHFDVTASCNHIRLSHIELVHYRLGHPSNVKIQNLRNELQISSNSNFPAHCSICHLAKQRRLPFPSHNSLSAEPFDLIHCDIWGPFHTHSTEGFRYFLTIVDDSHVLHGCIFLSLKKMLFQFYPNSFLSF